jgi:cytoskeletal protein CcmA (bactofilin family)
MFKFFNESREDEMFKKQSAETTSPETAVKERPVEDTSRSASAAPERKQTNTIVKGSRLTGDIVITYDLELYGDVEGNITSEQKSNIIIRGSCKGNIRTKEGSVELDGNMSKGDIYAGGDIRITGSFRGGRAEAKGRIYVDGEFSGTLSAKEIEVGPHAKGKGELLYQEFISIARGARVEASISRSQGTAKPEKEAAGTKVVNIDRSAPEKQAAAKK